MLCCQHHSEGGNGICWDDRCFRGWSGARWMRRPSLKSHSCWEKPGQDFLTGEETAAAQRRDGLTRALTAVAVRGSSHGIGSMEVTAPAPEG